MLEAVPMEEKESPVYASGASSGNSETESPPAPMSGVVVVPHVGNASMDGSGGSAAAPTTTSTAAVPPAPAPGSGGGQGSMDMFGKKKRGRPRKYDADGNLRSPYQSPPGFSFSPSSPSSAEFSAKRGRGRPPGSGNWQLLASLGELFANTAGGDFTPHVVTVNTGEDVAGKILSFAQKGPRGICILSANGAVSNVTIRQPGSSGGILTYEGRFEILSLTGSFTVTDTGGVRSRTGGLSVSLAGPDGRVIGGGIAGLLTAAGPIQIVVGSFMPNGFKAHKKKHHREHNSAAHDLASVATPVSQTKPDGEACLNAASPSVGRSQEEVDNSTSEKQVHGPGPGATAGATSTQISFWNGSSPGLDQKQSPDINITATGE